MRFTWETGENAEDCKEGICWIVLLIRFSCWIQLIFPSSYEIPKKSKSDIVASVWVKPVRKIPVEMKKNRKLDCSTVGIIQIFCTSVIKETFVTVYFSHSYWA